MYICKSEFHSFPEIINRIFNILIITATASSIRTDGYKFTTWKEVCTSLGDMFHSFASSTNEDESKTQCLFLFEGGSIILTKYFEVPYAGNPIVDTTALME